jgi:hypothetical protein
MRPRRFPVPWTVHHDNDAYWVQDANGQAFAYCYYRDPAHHTSVMIARLSEDEARRITANIAKLPEMLKKEK